MALLQVHEFPDSLYNQLSEMAQKKGLNVEQETLFLLEQAIRQSHKREMINKHIHDALFDAPETVQAHL